MNDSIEKLLEDLTSALTDGFNRVEARHDVLDAKIDRVDNKASRIEHRIDVMTDDLRVIKTSVERIDKLKLPERVKELEESA